MSVVLHVVSICRYLLIKAEKNVVAITMTGAIFSRVISLACSRIMSPKSGTWGMNHTTYLSIICCSCVGRNTSTFST